MNRKKIRTKPTAQPQRDDRILSEMLEMGAALSRHGLFSKEDIAQLRAICGTPPVYTPERVTRVRTTRARMSQSVFAEVLNVSVSAVQKWESPGSGKHPTGAAAKLLQLIVKNGVEAVLA